MIFAVIGDLKSAQIIELPAELREILGLYFKGVRRDRAVRIPDVIPASGRAAKLTPEPAATTAFEPKNILVELETEVIEEESEEVTPEVARKPAPESFDLYPLVTSI